MKRAKRLILRLVTDSNIWIRGILSVLGFVAGDEETPFEAFKSDIELLKEIERDCCGLVSVGLIVL
jgi:hypothetical protein